MLSINSISPMLSSAANPQAGRAGAESAHPGPRNAANAPAHDRNASANDPHTQARAAVVGALIHGLGNVEGVKDAVSELNDTKDILNQIKSKLMDAATAPAGAGRPTSQR